MSASYPIATPAARSSRAGIGGPKTAEGKARSALNAVKNGLASASPVILEHETEADWDSFRERFVAALHPVGVVEEALALELATTDWRRRRLPRYEARAAGLRIQRIEPQLADIDHRCTPSELEHRAAELFNEALLPDFNTADRLLRYEAHLDRKFNNAFRHLERLQKTRLTLETPETLDYKTNSTPAPNPAPEPPASIQPSYPEPSDNRICETNSNPAPNRSPEPPASIEPSYPEHLDSRICKTKAHALRAPWVHENEPRCGTVTTDAPKHFEPRQHPGAGRAQLWSPWRGGQLDDWSLDPFHHQSGNAPGVKPRAEGVATATRH